MNILNKAFLESDRMVILNYCLTEFGIIVNLADLKSIMKQGKSLATGKYCGSWSDASFRCWIKNRVENYFRAGGAYAINERICSAKMHIFFPHLVEDELMLYRLRRPEPEKEPEVATSKIFNDASRIPTPIDRTAQRVANPKGPR